MLTAPFCPIFVLHFTYSTPTLHLRKAPWFRLIVHWGNIRPTLFFLYSGILRGNIDMLRRGKLLWSSRNWAEESPEMCFQLAGSTQTANSNITPSKKASLPGSTELQPPWPPLSNTDRKHSAGLPGQESWRMSTFSEEDEIERQIKSFCLVKGCV